MTKHFFQLYDSKGKQIAEIVARDIRLLSHEDDKTIYEIGEEVEGAPVISLPSGFSIRRIA